MADQLTLPTCVLPGCTEIVGDPTQPCGGCLALFGPWLRETEERTLTAEVIAKRDRGVHAAYAAQLRAEMIAEAAEAADRAVAIARGEPERKAMQLCWICEQRRTCTRIADQWECPVCEEIS